MYLPFCCLSHTYCLLPLWKTVTRLKNCIAKITVLSHLRCYIKGNLKFLLSFPATHDRHKEWHFCSEMENQKQLDTTRLLSSQWQSRRADHHNWIPVGCTHMVLVLCSSRPGDGPQHIALTASQERGRTPCSSWLAPRANSCLCACICTPHQHRVRSSNIEHSHLIFSAVTGVWGCVFKGERGEHTTDKCWSAIKQIAGKKQPLLGSDHDSTFYKLSHQHSLNHSTCWLNMEQWTEEANHICLVTNHVWKGYPLPALGSLTMALC